MMIHSTEPDQDSDPDSDPDQQHFHEGRAHEGSSAPVATTPRPKRSALQLYNMVLCATNCNPLTYKGYGCYCGFLGSGYPVDPIDRCCKMHDWCYSAADCPMFLEYFIPYVWTCYRRRPLCAYGRHSCNQRLCECDRKLAECLRRYPCPRRKAVCTSSPWRLFQNLLML
ncbi:basic phospholipase A2 [Bemisia tabaci]